VGIGIGGSKDTCMRLGKEAACLRAVGSRNPEPDIARLEEELTALGNYIGIGAMGFAGTSLVVATHIEIAFTHTGGLPVGIHQFCLSSRRATARLHPDGRVEFRSDPDWFTDYYRREGIE
jgi:L(+)-tartrate dehydratase alpha subunit